MRHSSILVGKSFLHLRLHIKKCLKGAVVKVKLQRFLKNNTRRIGVEVKLGKYAREKEDKPFGEGIISNKSLDEVILDYLTSEQKAKR